MVKRVLFIALLAGMVNVHVIQIVQAMDGNAEEMLGRGRGYVRVEEDLNNEGGDGAQKKTWSCAKYAKCALAVASVMACCVLAGWLIHGESSEDSTTDSPTTLPTSAPTHVCPTLILPEFTNVSYPQACELYPVHLPLTINCSYLNAPVPDSGGNTLLHFHTMCNHPFHIGFFLGWGACQDIKNDAGETAYELAQGLACVDPDKYAKVLSFFEHFSHGGYDSCCPTNASTTASPAIIPTPAPTHVCPALILPKIGNVSYPQACELYPKHLPVSGEINCSYLNDPVSDSGGNTLLHFHVMCNHGFHVAFFLGWGACQDIKNDAGETAYELAQGLVCVDPDKYAVLVNFFEHFRHGGYNQCCP